MATLEAMNGSKLILEPPIAAPDEHAQFVEAEQRFQAALAQAIATGDECIEAVKATVQLKRRRTVAGASVQRGSFGGADKHRERRPH
jgi:hypothetical protein